MVPALNQFSAVLAYYDPGAGSLLLQAILGGTAGLIVFTRYLWRCRHTLFRFRRWPGRHDSRDTVTQRRQDAKDENTQSSKPANGAEVPHSNQNVSSDSIHEGSQPLAGRFDGQQTPVPNRATH
jgi:hypothetical protein